jgi:hypothetical protein
MSDVPDPVDPDEPVVFPAEVFVLGDPPDSNDDAPQPA